MSSPVKESFATPEEEAVQKFERSKQWAGIKLKEGEVQKYMWGLFGNQPEKDVLFRVQNSGDLVNKEALALTREKFEATQHLLGSMDPPAEYGCKLAFPDLQPIYGRDSLEELFDKNNMPTSEFLRRVRSFAGDLIYRHFRGT